MDSREVWERYRKVYVRIVDDLVIDPSFLAHFVQDNVFRRAVEDTIMTKVRSISKAAGAAEFVSVVKSQGERGLNTFYDALQATQQYELADIVFPERVNHEAPQQDQTRSAETSMTTRLPAPNHGGDRLDTATDVRPPTTSFIGDEAFTPSRPSQDVASSQGATTTSHGASSRRSTARLTAPQESHHSQGMSDSESDMSDGEALNDDSSEQMVYQLKATTREKIKRKFGTKNVYPVSQPVRGRVYIINNEEFDRAVNKDQVDLDYREGTETDRDNLGTVFKDLGFIVTGINNASSARMIDLISKETELEEHKNYGMFVLVILSHGENDIVYGNDGRKVYVEDIYRRLSPENFPHMKGKPKWIILQACSGNKKDHYGVTTDSFPSPIAPPNVIHSAPSLGAASTTSTSDMLILKSSFPGYVSLRDTKLGSYMVRALVEVLYKHVCHRHIEDLMKEVRKRVANKSSEAGNAQGKQTITHTSTLYHDLYLFPGFNPQ